MISSRRKTWGLVLSGGNAYGIANAGVIAVLEREGFRPDYVAGSSMGAIIGALYALGHGPETLKRLCDDLRLTNVAAVHWPWREGMLRQRLEEHLQELVGDKRIGDCAIPFLCVAGRVRDRVKWLKMLRPGFAAHMRSCVEPYVFPPETRILDALRASSAVPLLFRPATVGQDTFVDLLSFGSMPVQELRDAFHPDAVIATDTNERWSAILRLAPVGWQEALREGHAQIAKSRAASDLVLDPVLRGSPFRYDRARRFYTAGEAAAEQALPAIRALFSGDCS